jgi:hypothetical protein
LINVEVLILGQPRKDKEKSEEEILKEKKVQE